MTSAPPLDCNPSPVRPEPSTGPTSFTTSKAGPTPRDHVRSSRARTSSGEITAEAAGSIVAAISTWPNDGGSASAVIESLSGAVSDVDAADTAFPWRRQAACVQWYTEPPSPELVETANKWLADAHAAVHAHSIGGYVNYVESATPPSRYFGDNLARLAAVRQQYDPGALMHSAMTY